MGGGLQAERGRLPEREDRASARSLFQRKMDGGRLRDRRQGRREMETRATDYAIKGAAQPGRKKRTEALEFFQRSLLGPLRPSIYQRSVK